MRAEDIELVRRSHAQLRDATAFGRRFYALLFELQPQARRLFPADMEAQVRKLTDMVDAIVGGLDRPEELRATFTALGQRHAGYGVGEADYDEHRRNRPRRERGRTGDCRPTGAKLLERHRGRRR